MGGESDVVRASGRDRVLEAAYELFSRGGVKATGVDTVIAEAGVAKMTLYRNFGSKEELALAFLELREQRWTYGWICAAVAERAETPAGMLLAIFDVFEDWFAREDFEGCSFINVLVELHGQESAVGEAAARYLANIRALLAGLAAQAGIEEPDAFAHQWQLLMKGAIVSAMAGDRDAARRARSIGELLLRSRGVQV